MKKGSLEADVKKEIKDLYTDEQTKEQMIKFSQYTTAQSIIVDVIGKTLCKHDTPLLIFQFNQGKIAYDGCSISSFNKKRSGEILLENEDADLVSKILRSGSDKFTEIFHQNEIESLNHIIDDGSDQEIVHKSAIQLLEELSKPILKTNFFIDKVKLKIKEDDLSKLKEVILQFDTIRESDISLEQNTYLINIQQGLDISKFNRHIMDSGISITHFSTRTKSLEEFFIQTTQS